MDRTLSKDIRWLGDALGEVLKQSGSEQLFSIVEAMRKLAKTARASGKKAAQARQELRERAASLSADEALGAVRAFTLYFQLVNLAEDVQRIRVLRQRERQSSSQSVAESLPWAIDRLRKDGMSESEVHDCLKALSIRFVFTAHPTEARRRSTERLLANVRSVLEATDRTATTPTDARRLQRKLEAAIEALWHHAPLRDKAPTVLDEVQAGLWYADNVLFDVLPRLTRRLRHGFDGAFGHTPELPMCISFGSWMGGDRDGNPFVHDATLERALELSRELVLGRYRRDVRELMDPLAVRLEAKRHPALERALTRGFRALSENEEAIKNRNPTEPLRQLLSICDERLARAGRHAASGYGGPDELLADLDALATTLTEVGATALATDALLDLRERVRCFGFHLFTLDVREDARVHREAFAQLLGDSQYAERSSAERVQAIAGLDLSKVDEPAMSDEAARIVDCMKTIARAQKQHSARAVETYIISMCEQAADVVEIARLAEQLGLYGKLDVVPLLETATALEGASDLLEELFTNPWYRDWLERRGNVQELLVGYSDSMKENGIFFSRVTIHRAQRRALEVCRRHGIELRVFHGRGGSISRGGGPTHRALTALDPEAFCPRFKVTEQGETRAAHFATPDLAARHIEQTLSGALLSEARRRRAEPKKGSGNRLERIAIRSQDAYRRLVSDDDLVDYFTQATPAQILATLHLGSRPAKRGRGPAKELGDLRAIPWVFAWSQCRAVVTGWYGVGSGLAGALKDPDGLARLRKQYQKDAFFRDVLDNVQMVLAKSDLEIARNYASLAPKGTSERIFKKLLKEFERTRETVLAVADRPDLLASDPTILKSIQLRNPYVDPLSYLQVEAIRRMRSGERAFEEVARAAVLGIAAGLRNTG